MDYTVKQYIEEINSLIICPSSVKKSFLEQMKTEAFCFCSDHCDTNVDMLSLQFGSPEEVAEEFMLECGPVAVNRSVNVWKQVMRLVTTVILVVIVFTVCLGMRAFFLRQALLDKVIIASITYDESSNDYSWFSAQNMIFDSRDNSVTLPNK